jgi:hypothetical protein
LRTHRESDTEIAKSNSMKIDEEWDIKKGRIFGQEKLPS